MKILKTIGIILAVLAAIFVIVGFLLPSKFHSERSLIIAAPQEQLFEQVNNVKNWDNWSVWNKMDPNWKVTFSPETSGVGAWYSWTSEMKEVGNGKISVTKSEPLNLVEAKMEFAGMEPATLNHKFEATDGGIKVTFSMDADLGKNIMTKYFFALMGDKMLGGNYEKSLKSLQDYLKNAPAPTPAPENSPSDSLPNGNDTIVKGTI